MLEEGANKGSVALGAGKGRRHDDDRRAAAGDNPDFLGPEAEELWLDAAEVMTTGSFGAEEARRALTTRQPTQASLNLCPRWLSALPLSLFNLHSPSMHLQNYLRYPPPPSPRPRDFEDRGTARRSPPGAGPGTLALSSLPNETGRVELVRVRPL